MDPNLLIPYTHIFHVRYKTRVVKFMYSRQMTILFMYVST